MRIKQKVLLFLFPLPKLGNKATENGNKSIKYMCNYFTAVKAFAEYFTGQNNIEWKTICGFFLVSVKKVSGSLFYNKNIKKFVWNGPWLYQDNFTDIQTKTICIETHTNMYLSTCVSPQQMEVICWSLSSSKIKNAWRTAHRIVKGCNLRNRVNTALFSVVQIDILV